MQTATTALHMTNAFTEVSHSDSDSACLETSELQVRSVGLLYRFVRHLATCHSPDDERRPAEGVL